MNKTKILLVIVTALMLTSIISTVVPTTTQGRSNTVWAAGYQTKAEDFMPYSNNPAYGVAFMYEPLFGYNFLKDVPIPVIGSTYTWADNGAYVTVDLNPAATWSDGEKIDADDVVFSYNLAADQIKFQADMDERLASISAVDADTVRFNLKSDYYFSSKLFEWLTTDVYIVPEHVWEEIVVQEGDEGNLDEFNNDWFDGTFDEDWKVCSGPYTPYYRSATLDEEIYEMRDEWWGLGVIHTDIPNTQGHPQAQYIGLRQYPTNTAQDTAFLTGVIDLHAGYYDKIWLAMDDNPKISTWYGQEEPYYLGLGAVIEIAFNHLKYPLVEPWLRRALAFTLDYDDISLTAASGYWSKARQGFLDDRSPAHISVYDASVEEANAVTFDVEEAESILDEYCYQKGGKWYTDDVPTEYQGMPGATDDDPATAGINVELGGWEILVPTGWSDVVKATELWAESFTDFGVPTTKKEIDFGSAFQPALADNNYDLAMHCCGPHLVNPPITVLAGQRGTHQWNSNVSNWYNPEFNSLYESYETLEPDSTAQLEAASDMQELLATEMPSIPTHANGFWYTFSTQYWEGWVSEANAYNQVCTAYTVNWAAVKQRLILALYPAGAPPFPAIPWTGLFLSIGLSVVITTVLVGRRMKVNKGK